MESVSLLLDTHAFLWWLIDSPRLSESAKQAITNQNNRIIVSAASAWEIATKYRIGKLPEAKDLLDDFEACIRRERFESLSITVTHARHAGMLPGPHRDPFDRMLIAQGQVENIPIVTNDAAFEQYDVAIIW